MKQRGVSVGRQGNIYTRISLERNPQEKLFLDMIPCFDRKNGRLFSGPDCIVAHSLLGFCIPLC